jgi:hypothetical protein
VDSLYKQVQTPEGNVNEIMGTPMKSFDEQECFLMFFVSISLQTCGF